MGGRLCVIEDTDLEFAQLMTGQCLQVSSNKQIDH